MPNDCIEARKALIRRYYNELWNPWNFDLAHDLSRAIAHANRSRIVSAIRMQRAINVKVGCVEPLVGNTAELPI